MKRYLSALAIVTLTGLSAGCLVKETTHRVYLSGEGAVTWMVLEQGVRSAEDDGAQRSQEEREWLAAIAGDAHPIADALRRLGAEHVTTRLVRSQRPYTVLTTGRFARIDLAVGQLCEELGIRGAASLAKVAGERMELSVTVDLASLDAQESETESPVTALLEDLEQYRFGLTDGRFVSADGFDIQEDGAVATLKKIPAERFDAGGPLTLRLVWTTR